MSPRSFGPVVLATCSAVAGQEPEDLQVIESLRRQGIEALHVAWDDPDFEWPTVPLTVVRSTWDYPARRTEFLTWADCQPYVLNPASVLRWNTDKHYLNDLADAGFTSSPLASWNGPTRSIHPRYRLLSSQRFLAAPGTRRVTTPMTSQWPART